MSMLILSALMIYVPGHAVTCEEMPDYKSDRLLAWQNAAPEMADAIKYFEVDSCPSCHPVTEEVL